MLFFFHQYLNQKPSICRTFFVSYQFPESLKCLQGAIFTNFSRYLKLQFPKNCPLLSCYFKSMSGSPAFFVEHSNYQLVRLHRNRHEPKTPEKAIIIDFAFVFNVRLFRRHRFVCLFQNLKRELPF